MEKTTPAAARDVVLVGGGHSHALLLRRLGAKPLGNGARVTVVSDVTHAPYSGMLPGLIAGIYSWDEAHIDLPRLCAFAGARFVLGKVDRLDLDARNVHVEGGGAIGFDVVSLNTGSTPRIADVPGADAFAIPSKPVPRLLAAWESFAADTDADAAPGKTVTLVGGGAGGVELALCFDRRLGGRARIRIVHAGDEILESHNPGVRRRFRKILAARGVDVITGHRVTEVRRDGIRLDDGRDLPGDAVFWVTHATPQTWPAEAGLRCTPEGFVLVGETLQSLSHPFVFAAGDLATIAGRTRPKSGVFAVRMARPLLGNLRRYLSGKRLRRYRPQTAYLSLIGTAAGTAVASRRWLAWHSQLMWKWKDWIDRRFMRQFRDLPETKQPRQ